MKWLKLELREEQKNAVEQLIWLLSPLMQNGKSTAIAVGLIETAKKYNGCPVHIFDHFSNTRHDLERFLSQKLYPLIEMFNDYYSDKAEQLRIIINKDKFYIQCEYLSSRALKGV